MTAIYYPIHDEKNVFFEPRSLDDFELLANKSIRGSAPEIIKSSFSDAYEGDITWCDNSTVILINKRITSIPDFECLNVCSIEKCVDYYLLIAEHLDCLDYKKSKIEYFNNSTKIKGIKKYSFKKDAFPEDSLCFKIKGLDYSPMFFTEKFIKLYKKHNLRGMSFKKL